MLDLLKKTVREFLDDDCMRMAAALAYYTVFALPPLLLLLLLIAGAFIDPGQLQALIEGEMGRILGEEGAEQVRSMMEGARGAAASGPLAGILSVLGLAFGATGAFAQLQGALNKAWDVEPEGGGVRAFLVKRALSLGMVLVLAFLLLVSMVLSAFLSALGGAVARLLPGELSTVFLYALNLAFSLAMATLLFAAIYRVLPDAEVAWRDVWSGAVATAVLFVLGQTLLALYLARSDPGSAFGAAGSLALLLLWVYYSSIILLLGAEFTQVWARRRGGGVRPEAGAEPA